MEKVYLPFVSDASVLLNEEKAEKLMADMDASTNDLEEFIDGYEETVKR